MTGQNPQFQPTPQPRPDLPYSGHQPPKKKRTGRTVAIVGGSIFGGLVILGVIGSFLPDNTVQTADSAPLPNVVTTTTAAPSPEPVVTPTVKPKPAATTSKPVAPKTTAAPKPIVYKKLTKREWAKIAKSPDSHAGEAYTVYGVVTQFDSATGDDQFRADVDGVKHAPSYGFVDYPTNTLMTNITGDVSELVQDDLFTAKVIVIGSFSYDTQIGGETTVPQLSIISIKVTGSVK